MSALAVQQVGTREPPAWLIEDINRAGGTYDSRPRFRVIWGGNRLVPGPDGITLVHPYRLDMWHLEKLHEGEYEHCSRLGECPVQGDHRKTKKDEWCRKCFMDGGVPLPIEGCSGYIAGLIRLILDTEHMQKKAKDNATVRNAQKDALFGREEKRAEERKEIEREVFAEAMPKTIKRSFETPLRIGAHQALGTTRGIRQMNAREIIRGLRGRKSCRQGQR